MSDQQETSVLDDKRARLESAIRKCGTLAVAFSGGVDSTFLLACAHRLLGDGAIAVIARTPFVPAAEAAEAEAFCEARGIRLLHVDIDPLEDDAIASNPLDRCYACKHLIFSHIKEVAAAQGVFQVADGTNADDASDYRPGMRALRELGIMSPLLDAGLTKKDVRKLSRDEGLSTWDKPSMACLASRIPYGDAITPEVLERVERAEAFLHDMEFEDLRVRAHGDIARIEIYPLQLPRLVEPEMRRLVVARLKELGFTYVCADLEGFRSGSMNVGM